MNVEVNKRLRLATYEVVEDLIPNDRNHIEGLLGCNRVHNHVAMDANEVL
jgi:hypothetical protein